MHKASVEERLKLKRLQIDTWSNREQLCLASSVLRSGDQNWVSVSRSVKVLGDPGRPADWFSQKNCALQYDSLLENVETPKRKRGDKGEESKPATPGECIVQKLTMIRIDELKRLLAQEKERYKKIKVDVIELSAGRSEQRLVEINQLVEQEKKQKELDVIAHEQRLRDREQKIIEIQRAFRPQGYLAVRKTPTVTRPAGPLELSISSDTEASQGSPLTTPVVDVSCESTPIKTEEKTPGSAPTPTSPLLTSLLKSPSPAPAAQRVTLSSPASATPTISSLLASSPVKREGTPFSPGLSHLVTSAISGGGTEIVPGVQEEQMRPQPSTPTTSAAGTSTLSMLLELPPSVPGTPLPELPPAIPHTVSGQVLPIEQPSAPPAENQTVEIKRELIVGATHLLPVPLSTGLDISMDDNQLDKIVKEIKAEQQNLAPSTQESVLEELPQEVVALIEEVEMAEEEAANKLKMQQQEQLPQPPLPVQEEQKIQEIQQQLVAYVPLQVVAETPKVPSPKPPSPPPALLEPEPEPASISSTEEVAEESVEVTSTSEEVETPAVREEKEEEQKEAEVKAEVSETEEVAEEEAAKEVPEEIEDKEVVEEKPEEPETTAPVEDVKEVEEEEEEEITEEESVDVPSIPETHRPVEQDTEEEVEELEDTEAEGEIRLPTPGPIMEHPSPPPTPPSPPLPPEGITWDVDEESKDVSEEELSSPPEIPPPAQPSVEEQRELLLPQLPPQTPQTRTTRRSGAVQQQVSTPSTPVDSLPNSPASVGHMDDDKEYRAWKKAILLMWARIAAHKNASVFIRPISNDMAPGYHSVVFRPMDLTTIKRNIESGQIRNTLEFQRDLMLMFTNAIMYNASEHQVSLLAQEMQKDCLTQIRMFKTAQESSSLRRETREANKMRGQGDNSVAGDGDDSEASAPSPLPITRKRGTTTPGDSSKKRRMSFMQ